MELVYMDGKKEPYTTSEIIAECAEVTHHTVQELLRKHKADFESYGIIAFEMRKLDGRGRPMKIYRLNEQQATLLITYLKNTEPVRRFKMNLVKAFFEMREELSKFRMQRAPLPEYYKVSSESDSTNILLSFQHRVVMCGASTPLVRTISTIGAEHQHIG